MNFPLNIKRNENCARIIKNFMEHGSSCHKYYRKSIRERENVRIEQRSMKDQRMLCILYRGLVEGNIDWRMFSLLNQCCTKCEINEYMKEHEDIEIMITRKAELEAEYKVICESLKNRGVIT